MRRAVWLLTGSLTAGVGTMLAGIGLMASSGYLISRAAERPPILDLMLVFVSVRFFGLTRPALRYAERLASHELTFRALRRIRSWIVTSLLPLSLGQMATFRSGDLLSRLSADVDTMQDSYLRVIAPAITAIIVSAVVTAGVALIDERIAVVLLTSVAAYGLGWSWFAYRQSRGMGIRRNQIRREFSADLVAAIQAREDLLTCGCEDRAREQFAALQRRLAVVERRDGRALAAHAFVGVIVTLSTAVAVLTLALDRAAGGTLPVIWLAPLMIVAIAAFDCVEGLPAAWQFAGQTRDSARRLTEIARTPPAVTQVEDPVALDGLPPRIALDHVTFGYGGSLVLRDVTLRIEPGEHVALVGATGSGKTTLLQLLMRGWDPVSGSVRINDVDLRRIELDSLVRQIAVLPQQVHVFNDTLRYNVTLGRPHATDGETLDVLTRAGLAAFVSRAPKGLDTALGEHGARMSAGERQRLGLARILLTDATLVLADEPTAHLDARTERDMLDTLLAWSSARTLVIASHRASVLDRMSRVFAIADGEVGLVARR